MWKKAPCTFRSFLSTASLSTSSNLRSSKQVCIVGSGPAGFYFAQNLFKKFPDVTIDMYEKLPVPYGLVRYGVAPDHPEVKNVITTFDKTASHPNFRFVGNVTLGKDVTFADLRNAYHAVVLTYGCSEDNKLGIPGESLLNVVSARKFVGWYNGLPEDKDLDFNLDCESVVVLGQGNVAVDVSRILLSPVDTLKVTDITEHSLERLSRSKVKTVHLVGRRGPLQAAFTIKEFREMTKLPQVQTVFQNEQFTGTEKLIPGLPRARRRLSELLVSTSLTKQDGGKFFKPIFLHKPVEIVAAPSSNLVKAVEFELNDIDHEKGVVTATGMRNVVDCGLVLRSIGYKGSSPDTGLPFNRDKGVICNGNGVYSAGWIHQGPTGVILSTMTDAFEQSNVLVADIQQNKLDVTSSKPGLSAVNHVLKAKNVVTVSYEGWKKIDSEEIRRGSTVGKPREKITDIQEMLDIGCS